MHHFDRVLQASGGYRSPPSQLLGSLQPLADQHRVTKPQTLIGRWGKFCGSIHSPDQRSGDEIRLNSS